MDFREEVVTPDGCTNLLFGIIFADNYMEMKKIGLGGVSPVSPRSATEKNLGRWRSYFLISSRL